MLGQGRAALPTIALMEPAAEGRPPRVSPGGSYPVNGWSVPYGARGYSLVSNGHQTQAYGNHLRFEGIYTNTVLPVYGPSVPANIALLSPTSKLAVVGTINFALGALNSSREYWMAFFEDSFQAWYHD